MRRHIWLMGLAAILAISTTAWCRQSGQSQSQSQNQTQDPSAQASAPRQDSIADAARRAKEQKKEEPKAARVFTNDDLPTNAPLSVVGSISAPPSGKPTGTAPGKAPASDEKMWRDKFAKLNHKLEQDQADVDVLQRELGVLDTQYYGGDPMKGMQQGMSQADINAKTARIDARKKDVEADQQAISDAESDLQKAGGDPGWER